MHSVRAMPNNTIEPDKETEHRDSLNRRIRTCPSCNGRVILKYG
jgi:hypothetical protein